MARIWLHRISHEWETSYALFDMGYLTLGWSLYADTNILDSARMNDKDLFECIYDQKRNEEKKTNDLLKKLNGIESRKKEICLG